MTALTPREREVAGLVARGLQVTEIAQRLHVSPSTVREHKRRIYLRLGVRNAVEMMIALGSGR